MRLTSVRWQHWRTDLGGVGAVIVLAAIAWFGQVSPLLSRHASANANMVRLGELRGEADALEHTLLQAKAELERTKKATGGAQLTLRPVGELNQCLAQLTEFASQRDLVVDTIESGQPATFARYGTVPIRLGGRGTFGSCDEAVRLLRSSMPDVGVVSFQMTSAGVSNDTAVSFIFELLWYTQPQLPAPKK